MKALSRCPLLVLLLFVCHGATFAQGTVRGRVTDNLGETLIGATVLLKGANGVGAITDLDGNYSLQLPAGTSTVAVSYFGFEAKEFTVAPQGGEVIVKNIALGEKSFDLGTVEIEGKARRASDTYLDRLKANAPTSFDFISKDAIKKTGDPDASQAIKRVTGVSTVGAYVTVRGLADRYLVTTVNGGRVPTMDPLTNNLRLDLFPTGLLDNIIITKTLTPDLPADWAGAYISLNTSDFPQRLQVNFTSTAGYNTNATGKDIITSKRSSTDWLGYDDGLRAIPDGVSPDAEQFPNFIEPDLYQQLGVLGLSGYLNSLGIVASTPGFQTTRMSTDVTLHHVALTRLGLLGAAQLYDANAVQNAVSTYNTNFGLSYFSPILNGELEDLNKRFNNANWRLITEKGKPNFSQTLSIGNQLTLGKKSKNPRTLGYLVGFRYGTDTQYDPDAVLQRTGEDFNDTEPGSDLGIRGRQSISVLADSWSAVGNLGFKLDRNNSFSLMIMPSRMGQNNARYLEFVQPGLGGETYVSEDQFYEQRRLWVYQYGSKHLIPALNLTVEADASYSDGKRDLLDLRIVTYVKPPEGVPITETEGQLTQPGRVYRFMTETMMDARLGFELPLAEPVPNRARKLKFGGSYRRNERRNEQAYFQVRGAPGPAQWNEASRFEIGPDGRIPSLYTPFGTFKDNDIGILDVWAGYLMTDHAFTTRLRVTGGVRAEHTDLVSDILRFHEEGIAADDPVRGTVGDVAINGASAPEPKPAVPGTIDRWDILPSANFIYRLVDEETAPTNLRLGYFRSLARPSFREFSVVQLYDYGLRSFTFGNPDLRMVSIDNFDLRLERFLKNGNTVSLSGFYKRFDGHIELLQTQAGGFTWRNAKLSEVYGLELEGRVSLMRSLEWRGNLSWMYSRSDIPRGVNGTTGTFSTRMFGQAPWLVNSTLSYAPDSSGFSASVSYNVQGPKLAITNSETAPDAIRAYEVPRHIVDLTVGQKLGRHWSLYGRVRNLLNAPMRRSYLFASGYDADFDSYAWGTEYSISLSYVIQ